MLLSPRFNSDSDAVPTYVYDLEIFPNFFLAAFKEPTEARNTPIRLFLWEEREALVQFLSQPDLTLAGYNNHGFDDQLLKGIVAGEIVGLEDLFDATAALINRDKESDWPKRLRWLARPWLSVDLMQILGGPRLAGSLKEHEIRLGLLDVQDIPIVPGTHLTSSQMEHIVTYCANDMRATEALYFDLAPKIDVRRKVNERYPNLKGSALRQSDAAIAEAVMRDQLVQKANFDPALCLPPSTTSFAPEHRIDASIRFHRPDNEANLQKLRNFGSFDPAEWKERHCQHFTFEVGEHRVTLTQGGLHTQRSAAVIRSPNILEFDVSSYYPSLLLKGGRQPESLPSQWIDIVADLTRQRLAAKAAGDKTTADIYKIVINSLYGKLNDPYSINFDPALQLQVVLNGQLFLLMLMEQFAEAGFAIIAANTDGLYVDGGGRPADAIHIAEAWQAETGFNLERKSATIYAATSINSYALFHPDKGWFHRKGSFGGGHAKAPTVVHSAALEFLSSATEPELTLRREQNILPFLYSGAVKGRGAAVVQRDLPLQRTNRWYKGLGATDPILVTKPGAKPRKIPNSDGGVVCNSLRSLDLPADLNLNFYVAQARDLIAQLLQSEPAEIDQPKKVQAVRRAQDMGLVIVPKGLRHAPKANIPATYSSETIQMWRNTPAEKAVWGDYEGYGCYTGSDFGVIALDIDHITSAKASGIFDHLTAPTMVSWHGPAKAGDVRQGLVRGTLLFAYNGTDLKTTGASFLRDFGFEILYGKRVVQLAGWHLNKDAYHWAGTLKPLPDALLNLLTWLVPDDRQSDQPDDPQVGIVAQLEEFRRIANQDEQYLAVAGELMFTVDKDNRVHLKGRCIGHDRHSDPSQLDPMKVSVWCGEIRVSCFHESCEQVRAAWRDQIASQIVIRKPIKLAADKMVVETDHREVWAALNDTAKNKLIIAATGAGKTWGIVKFICSKLEDTEHLGKGGWDKFVILCSSKDQMQQIGQRFADVLESDNINEQGIDLIEAEEGLVIGRARSINEVRETTRVAITHYTYASRREFSDYYYAFHKFIDERTHVFIDEVDAFIGSQTSSIELGSRYRRVGKPSIGISKNVRVHKCGMHSGSNNCLNCTMHRYDGNMVSVDEYGVPVLVPRHEFIDADQRKLLEHVDFDHMDMGSVIVGTNQIRMLRQADDPGPMCFWNPGGETTPDGPPRTAPTFRETFFSLLKSAYLPTVYRPIILFDEKEIGRMELVQQYQDGATGRKLHIPEKDRARIKFPSRPCNVLTVTLIDRRPLLHIANAKSATMLTATLTSMHQTFLAEMLGSLARSNIEPRPELRLDRLVVIGYFKTIPAKQIVKGAWQFRKMLRFRETKRAADREYEQLRRGTLVVRYGHNRSDYRVNVDQVDKEHSLLLTYSLSTLGRGIDLPQYDVATVNGHIFKPVAAYVTDDPHRVRELIYEDRCNAILQNVGRVLRRKPDDPDGGAKVIVIENLDSEDELEYIANKLSGMAIEPVARWWVPRHLEIEDVCSWLTKICLTHQLPTDCPTGPQDILAEALSLVASGSSKKEIKQRLRWGVVRKTTDENELAEIELKVDEALKARLPEVRRAKLKSPEKLAKARQRRRKKIIDLIARGKSDAQIRNNMKVDDKKHGWPAEEVIWFEETLSGERGRALAAE